MPLIRADTTLFRPQFYPRTGLTVHCFHSTHHFADLPVWRLHDLLEAGGYLHRMLLFAGHRMLVLLCGNFLRSMHIPSPTFVQPNSLLLTPTHSLLVCNCLCRGAGMRCCTCALMLCSTRASLSLEVCHIVSLRLGVHTQYQHYIGECCLLSNFSSVLEGCLCIAHACAVQAFFLT